MPTITLRGSCDGIRYKYNEGTKGHCGFLFSGTIPTESDPYRRWLTRIDSETLDGTLLWRRQITMNRITGAFTITWLQAPKVIRTTCPAGTHSFFNWPQDPGGSEDLYVPWLLWCHSITAYTCWNDTPCQNAFLNNELTHALCPTSPYLGAGVTDISSYGDNPTRQITYIQEEYCTGVDLTWVYTEEYTDEYTYALLRSDCEAAMVEDANWTEALGAPAPAVDEFDPSLVSMTCNSQMHIREVRVQVLGYEYCIITRRIYSPAGYFEDDIIACTTTGALDECEGPCSGNWSEFDLIAPDWEMGGRDPGTGVWFIHNHDKYLTLNCIECPQMTAASATVTADDASVTADNYRPLPTPPT